MLQSRRYLHVVQPLAPDTIMELATVVTPSAARTQSCVMVIEDDRVSSEALTESLRGAGYRVEHCFDGTEALARLRSHALPDLIMLDLMMPNLNGWEFRVAQRREPAWASIPVIVMSGDKSPQASAIDADAHLTKPLLPTQVLDTVECLLQARERAQTEAKTAQLERMSSLGVLAAGLAHEVNNPLAFVSGNLELARKKCAELEPLLTPKAREGMQELQRLLDQAEHGAERIASVVRGVSTFARPDTEQVIPINVQKVIESSLQLVANEIRHHARLERDYGPVPTIMGNPAQLGQVLINLLINAVHAIGQDDASEQTIRVATRLNPEGQIVISVSDSGMGMTPELVNRIFDPFLSTKPVGAGMGLGLSICQRLVTNMGGTIRVESTPARGSTFSVTLPIGDHANEQVETAQVRKAHHTNTRPSVLVIDDEAMMCDLLRSMLQEEFEVTTFTSPKAALERLLTSTSPKFDVVLCDLMMPELTGVDLYTELVQKSPEQAARFIFMTGGTFTERSSEFLDRFDGQHLMKPFRGEALRMAIKACLQKNADTAPSIMAHN